MKVLGVNIGKARPIRTDEDSRMTGIFKTSVEGPVVIESSGFPGDDICATQHHGGPDQAVYVYGQPDYDWWAAQLGRELPPGMFGENLTVTDLESAQCNVGDRLIIGDVILEITAPRIPCSTFATKMEDTRFIKKFRHAERPGFYCRVIKSGSIRAGNEIAYESTTRPTVSVLDMFRDYYEPELTETAIRRFLDAPIAARSRAHKQRQLDALNEG